MESKNIKIIDEHSIDRSANIICSVDVDGSDYVIYWVERDADNDNIFVSKLIKNIDGTSNMINIDDTNEKEKMAEIVKELIKYAIDNEENKLSVKSLTLPNGVVVNISSVLFNKEQYINVQKTYITTVKKSVTKVSEDYYDIVSPQPEPVPASVTVVEPVIEPIPEGIPNLVAPAQTPVESVPVQPIVTPTPVVSPLENPVPITPVVPTVATVDVAPVTPAPSTDSVPVEVAPIPSTPVVQPVAPSVVPLPAEPTNVVPTPINIEDKVNIVEGPKMPEVTPVVAPSPIPTPTPAPIPVAEPKVEEPKIEPVTTASANTLVFDASKESNLNQALGEASKEATISIQDIEPVREFGVEEPVTAAPVVENVIPTPVQTPVASVPVEETPANTANQKAGFANNKFFMVVAIAFFLASCIFLGYEVFKYFQVK